MTDRIVSYRSEISLNRNICDFVILERVLFQLRATSREFTVNINNAIVSNARRSRCPPRERRCTDSPLLSSNRFKLCACPTMESLRVGGSARQRSFWLCYVREAILKFILVVLFQTTERLLANFCL